MFIVHDLKLKEVTCILPLILNRSKRLRDTIKYHKKLHVIVFSKKVKIKEGYL